MHAIRTRLPDRSTALLAAATALAAMATPLLLEAQSAQRFSIQASGLYVGVAGDAYEGMNAGPGIEAQVRFTPGLWSFGLGYQSSWHSHDEEGLGDESVVLAGVFFEPRRTFDVGSSTYAPYASARLAVLRESLDVPTTSGDITAEATGTQLNVGGGILFRVTPRVNFDLGATVGLINFGDLEISVPGSGSATVGTGGSGQNFVLRAGVAVGL